MLLLILVPVLMALAVFQRYLAMFAPSSILIRHVRNSPVRMRTALMLTSLTTCLLMAMRGLQLAIGAGAPAWLNFVALVLAWDATKVGLLGGQTAGRIVASVARRLVLPVVGVSSSATSDTGWTSSRSPGGEAPQG